MNNIMNNVRMENKICYLLGKYNINILYYASLVHTAQLVDMMLSSGFLPLITRPTRVTATSATSIYHIFTNYLEDSIEGFFITDVSDHFPIFHVSGKRQMSDVDTQTCKRLYSLNDMKEFCHAISTTNWAKINRATHTQRAFDLFHNRLSELYYKHSLKAGIKQKYKDRNPWLSKGLKNPISHEKNYMSSQRLNLF